MTCVTPQGETDSYEPALTPNLRETQFCPAVPAALRGTSLRATLHNE